MKYPTRGGLVVPPIELGFNDPSPENLRYRNTSNHHHYWTRQQYGRSAIHHTFRNLVDHVSPLVRQEHQGLHDKYSPPPMPHVGLMVDVLDEYLALHGVINLVREKATNEVREMSAAHWQQTRLNYKS